MCIPIGTHLLTTIERQHYFIGKVISLVFPVVFTFFSHIFYKFKKQKFFNKFPLKYIRTLLFEDLSSLKYYNIKHIIRKNSLQNSNVFYVKGIWEEGWMCMCQRDNNCRTYSHHVNYVNYLMMTM